MKNNTFSNSSAQEEYIPRRRAIKSIKAKHDEVRSWPQKTIDSINQAFGSTWFLAANIIWFFAWMIINFELVPLITPFDPFPFGLLTMTVSLEAIFLSILVLLSQNRESRINALREEVDLQVNIISEQELTKILELLVLLLKNQNIDVSADKELEEMLKKLNTSKIERVLEEQMI